MLRTIIGLLAVVWRTGLSFCISKNYFKVFFEDWLLATVIFIPWRVVGLRRILAPCQQVSYLCLIDRNDLLAYPGQLSQLIGRPPWRHQTVAMTIETRRQHQKPTAARYWCCGWLGLAGVGMKRRIRSSANSPIRNTRRRVLKSISIFLFINSTSSSRYGWSLCYQSLRRCVG